MILCSGCFDGFHVGHLWYLQKALDLRERADEQLVVAVAPDEYIQTVKKRLPQWSCAERSLVVQAIRGVTNVVPHGPLGVATLIRQLKPRLFVKGEDWRDTLEEDVRAACYRVAAEMVFVPLVNAAHTSDALSPQ